MTVNYRQLEECLANLREYKHGSSHAQWNGDNTYSVYSYATLMLTINSHGKVAFYNDHKYSMTTSRLQNIIKRKFNVTEADPTYRVVEGI